MFSIKDFYSKCDQIRRKLGIWSPLLKKSLMENFIFCAGHSLKTETHLEIITVPFRIILISGKKPRSVFVLFEITDAS